MNPEEKQQILDDEHLRLLALFHYISGGMTLAFSCLFLVQFAFMAAVFSQIGTMPQKPGMPAEAFPLLAFGLIFGFLICTSLALGVMQLLAGRAIARRQRRTMIMIVAAPGALFMPYGTLLSVMTWMVLSRPSVRAMYGEGD